MMSYQHPTIYDDDTAVPLGTTTHDEKERIVPLGMMMESPSSSSPPLWKTKKAGVVLLGLLGVTAMVASGGAARTEEAFLLQASGGADDNKCVPATGPWPTGAVSLDDDDDSYYDEDNALDGPYVTCFTARGGYCWSHSYYVDGDWKPCTPHGSGWSVYAPRVYAPNDDLSPPLLKDVVTCGTGCTEFSSDVPH